jgi:hypothetical protein
MAVGRVVVLVVQGVCYRMGLLRSLTMTPRQWPSAVLQYPAVMEPAVVHAVSTY